MKNRVWSFVLALMLCLALAAPTWADGARVSANHTISAGMYHAGVIDANGTLWMWGSNLAGQLGNGTTEGSSQPVKVLEDVVSVSCGYNHSAAIKSDGSLWAWGWQPLNGEWEKILQPTKVLERVAAVSCGHAITAAIKTDGSLWMWGNNQDGQLGIGNLEDSLVPVKVMDNVSAVSCAAFGYTTAAIQSDGSLWTWGRNDGEELGNNGQSENRPAFSITHCQFRHI